MDYTDYLMGLGLSEKTRRLYERHVETAETWIRRHTHTTLHWAGPKEVAAYADSLPNSHSTRGQVVAALRHYWDWKQRSDTPHRAIRVPPAPEMVCRAITETQTRDLVKTALGWWPKGTVVLCGLYLALRRFEIAKMEWERFTDDHTWYTVTGKYDKTHTLPVHPTLVAELENRQTGRWVFPGRYKGRHINSATVGAWVAEVGQSASIDDLEPHELRHTALATANDNTGNLRSVQTFARHAKPQTTSGYTRTTRSRLREVSDALDYL
jgi:integrase/recombinase XerD